MKLSNWILLSFYIFGLQVMADDEKLYEFLVKLVSILSWLYFARFIYAVSILCSMKLCWYFFQSFLSFSIYLHVLLNSDDIMSLWPSGSSPSNLTVDLSSFYITGFPLPHMFKPPDQSWFIQPNRGAADQLLKYFCRIYFKIEESF